MRMVVIRGNPGKGQNLPLHPAWEIFEDEYLLDQDYVDYSFSRWATPPVELDGRSETFIPNQKWFTGMWGPVDVDVKKSELTNYTHVFYLGHHYVRTFRKGADSWLGVLPGVNIWRIGLAENDMDFLSNRHVGYLFGGRAYKAYGNRYPEDLNTLADARTVYVHLDGCRTWSARGANQEVVEVWKMWVAAFRPLVFVGWEGGVTSKHLELFMAEYMRLVQLQPTATIASTVALANENALDNNEHDVFNSYQAGAMTNDNFNTIALERHNWAVPHVWTLNDYAYTVYEIFGPKKIE